MTTSAAMIATLPALRRYARALCGSKEKADDLVIKLFERWSLGPRTSTTKEPQIDAFRLLSDIWRSPIGNYIRQLEAEADESNSIIDERLAELDDLPRQAFLLSAMEGFSEEQSAFILSISLNTLRDALRSARCKMATQLSTKILVIEHDLLTGREIERIVFNQGHSVTEIAQTRKDALMSLERERPGLLVVGLSIADEKSGIDLASEILTTCPIPIIFASDWPQDIALVPHPKPATIIGKPIQEDELSAAITKAVFLQIKGVAVDYQNPEPHTDSVDIRLSGKK